MRVRTSFPHDIEERENVWITLADGTRLAARVWLPSGADAAPVPAVLEYLPYRKVDFTAHDDQLRHPYFAGHGYAAVRVDLRGCGDSDGLLAGEYLPQEQDDALEVLAWIAEQPWCTGAVGMIGYSWGGFNGLQIAARRPPELKAVITVASTDDRYLDDCHYMGGCMLGSDMLKWAASMLTYPIQPPDPRFVGEGWRDLWHHRLENAPELARDWASHQRRDDFWKHGSVAEDYAAIECPVLAAGGWADAYTNAVPRLLEHLDVPRLALIGPWAHMLPHIGVPGPAVGFLQEAVRFWDRWLKGEPNDAMDEPPMRAWIQEYVPPARCHETRPGRWVGIDAWPPAEAEPDRLTLRSDGSLSVGPLAQGSPSRVSILGIQECGEEAGVWCANGLGDEMAGDQRPDDERSLTFTGEPLAAAMDVVGFPVARLRVASDRPLALVAVRLEDVSPGGASLLVSWGMLNLTHRDSHEEPQPLEPGHMYDVAVELRVCGHRFAAGHRIRVALSPTYWPHAWPSPEPVTLEVEVDGASVLELPTILLDGDAPPPAFDPAEAPAPFPASAGDGAERTREVHVDPDTGTRQIVEHQRFVRTIPGTGAVYSETGVDRYSITPGDPLSVVTACERDTSSTGGSVDWSVRVAAEMRCDPTTFHITETYSASEAGEQVFSRTRSYAIPRDQV